SEVYLQVAMTRQQRSAITSWVGNIKKTDPAMAAAILAEKNKGKIPSKRTTIIKDSDVVRYLLIQQPALAAILGGQKGEENED
ncbi:MAG: hypothetical protein J2P36_08265, partial [Ktedonobacteraceae bacterium]|nr:hypothetical protein [Ktedonobacteraceae bacterium]